MKKIFVVIMCAVCTHVQAQPGIRTVFDMELFSFNKTIQYGNRTQLPMVDSLQQSVDTTLFLVKMKIKDTLYFVFFKQQPTTTGWLKVAQTPVIDNEFVDTVAFDIVLEPFTKGPVITFARSKKEESGILTHYFFEKYYLFFKRWEYSVR